MQLHIMPLHTPSTPRIGLKCKSIFFTESSHIAYQIKGNRTAHIMSLHVPMRPWARSVGHNIFLLKVVMQHIK